MHAERIALCDDQYPSTTLKNRLRHPCFLQPAETSIKVWRYLSLPKYISLLSSNELYFSRLDLLADDYEGSLTEQTIDVIEFGLKLQGMPDAMVDISTAFAESRKSTYVCCWHANEHESEAMWRLYAGADEGIAIQTSYAALVESIADQPEVYVGLVKYIDYKSGMFPSGNMFEPVMHKRMSFAHEREARFAWHSPPQPGAQGQEYLTMPWDTERHIHQIYVSPYSKSYFFESVRTVTEKISPILIPRIQWSKMREPPKK